ncbi:MAG: arsenate reductase (glutaredoxin) [Sandaracinaceae bacterium]|nr:arsenate reductase (glutaredoxin) [Sandaracinaceae bacterium]
MTKKAILYHNPRCSKSREALALIKERGLEVEVVEYLKDPPSLETLEAIAQKLGESAREMIRKKEAVFKERGFTDATPLAEVLKVMAEEPILLERPLLVTEDGAAVGRPMKNIIALIEGRG